MKKNHNKSISFILALSMVLSFVSPSFASKTTNPKKDSDLVNINRSKQKKSKIIDDYLSSEASIKADIEKEVYFIEFNKNADKNKIKKALNSIKDTKILYEYNIIFNGLAISTYPENIDYIKTIKGVADIEKSEKLNPLMENARSLVKVDKASNYLKNINAINPNLGKNYDGRGMVIANIDTGMDASHKAMRLDDDAKKVAKVKLDNLSEADKNFYISEKVPHSVNYLNGGKITTEKYDDGSDYHDPHGMHISGILAANDTMEDINKGKGIRGIAPNAQLFSYKMYSDASDGFAGDETMFHAFEDCIKHDVDVISISSGFTGTGLKGEKYWQAIRTLRNHGIPVCVATGNYATSASNSSWDRYANNALNMTDTGNVTRTAAHEDAIAVGSSRNTKINFDGVNIGGNDFRYSRIGAFFDPNSFKKDKYKFIYLGKCQDDDIAGKNLKDKIVIMDRIYTKDLKYSFKKAADKGAAGVIVVNTVSYYNRDDWESLPAMGYEEDEATKVQVFSISGMDGIKLWSMLTGSSDKVNIKSKKDSDYRIDMNLYNSLKPKVGEEKELNIKFLDKKIPWQDVNVPAGSTSWGPRVDLMLKPDVSAPGKNIYSTLNKIDGKDTYQYMSGTSMATPVVSGSTVIIRPKLKEMVKKPVIKSRGIDLVSLTKIMLQITSTPMIDPQTEENGTYLYASPRQQGSGLINVEKALKNNLVISYDLKDSSGQTNSYGAVSLKEIKTKKKDFRINIDNPTNRDITLKVSSSPITTDGEIKVKKLDEEYDEKSKTGIHTVNEIHPKKVDGAKLTFAKNEIVIPARGSYSLGASLDVGSLANKNKFIEGFINFESKEEKENTRKDPQPSLSMPFMGFAGDWNNEPIIDKWAWEDGSRSKGIVGYDDEGNPKIPGTLNRGRGGEHGIDLFKPAGVIQNREDDNKSLDQDPDLFAFNNSQDWDLESTGESKLIKDYETDRGLTPSPLILRSAADAKVSIVNSDNPKNQNYLKVLDVDHFIKGILNSKRNDSKGIKGSKLKVYGDLRWDGLIYNPHSVDKYDKNYVEGKFEPIAEGQYFYKFEYRLTPDYPYQISYIPVKIDRTPPEIVSVDASNPDEIKLKIKDSYHKQKEAYKNETIFTREQEKNLQKFEEVPNKVWFAGAAFVDENGEILDKLKVVNVGEKNKYNGFKLDKDGNSCYKILGANKNLLGKTIEIAALDGASNFTDLYQVKFDKKIINGKLGYSTVKSSYDPDIDDYIEEKNSAGKIDAKLLKNINTSEKKSDKNEANSSANLEGKPSINIDTTKSTIESLDNEDLNRIIKVKKIKKENPLTGIKEESYDYGDENSIDEYGLPSKYLDGSKMEFVDNSLDYFKDHNYIGKIILNANGGFDIEGVVKNVSKDAKIYFRSTAMKKTNKLGQVKAIPSTYNEKDKSMSFNLWANINDVDNNKGIDYKGDIELYVTDKNGSSQSVYIRMPKEKISKKTEDKIPTVESNYGNIIELGGADLNHGLKEKTDEAGNIYYEISDNLKIKNGYAVKIISINPGKTGLEALSSNIYTNDSKDVATKTANIKTLQGFTILRYEVYKLEKNSNGEAILNDENLVEEIGKIVYIDKDKVQLDMDSDSFNPYTNENNANYGELYIKKSPLVLRGKVGDKGGFNWNFRINESIVDQYLIYGDLNSDNSKDFEVKIDANDGDIMDWAAKDYIGNGEPEGIRSQYKIFIDNTKPEIELTNEKLDNSIGLKYEIDGKDKEVNLSITDKIDSGNPGRIQQKSILVNGKEYQANSLLNSYANYNNPDQVEIKVIATDYARNTKVQIYKLDLNTGKIENVQNPKVEVLVNATTNEVNLGEDFTLPEYEGAIPEEKEFAGWKVRDAIKKPGFTFNTQANIEITPVFKDKEKDYVTLNFESNGADGEIPEMKVVKGSEISLPENTLIAPDDKEFAGWLVSGNEDINNPKDKITVNDNITVTAIWKDIQ